MTGPPRKPPRKGRLRLYNLRRQLRRTACREVGIGCDEDIGKVVAWGKAQALLRLTSGTGPQWRAGVDWQTARQRAPTMKKAEPQANRAQQIKILWTINGSGLAKAAKSTTQSRLSSRRD
jgi:hypothetical protein